MKLHGAKGLLSLAVVLTTVSSSWGETPMNQIAVDPTLPNYERVEKLQGVLTLTGSNTMSQLAATWGDSFRRLYPDVQINIKVEGAVSAVDVVIDGTADLGLLSRAITEPEVRRFYAKFGYLPTVLTPVLEPQGIFVHKDNPIQTISLSQLDAVFSTTLKRGEAKTATTWGDLGLTGEWARVPIVAHGRLPDTGSQVFFKSAILGEGDFRPDMVPNKTNADLVNAIAADARGIGFTGSTFGNGQVKLVPISWRTGDEGVDVHNRAYPLVRPLQLVVNNNPEGKLNPLQMEFLKYVFSRSGQSDVLVGGFQPVPSGAANIALQALGGKTLN